MSKMNKVTQTRKKKIKEFLDEEGDRNKEGVDEIKKKDEGRRNLKRIRK